MSGLTPEQHAFRDGKMTASRVGKLLTGTEADITALWEEMTGRRDPDDLTWKWPVYLGTHTERLHLDWLEHVWGAPVERRGESVEHSELSWAGCTLDGWYEGPVEVKHVGGWEQRSVVIARYYPQVQWQCFVTGWHQGHLSIIEGAKEPAVTTLPRDEEYIAEMYDRAAAFMSCVMADTPPFGMPEAPVVVLPAELRTVDLDAPGDHPNWAGDMREAIEGWTATARAAKSNEASAKAIKKLLPDDVGELLCGGATVKRSKSNSILIREAKE